VGEIVRIEGSPAEAGRAYGALLAPVLRERVGAMRRASRGSRWGEAQLHERGERFRAFVRRIAPEWLDEAEAMAEAAGLAAADIFALNALPRGFWERETGGCTSCVVAGSQAANGATLLHKNRDLVNSPQDFHVRRTPEGRQLFVSRDTGTLGFTHLLRLVAERAADCDQALGVLEDAVASEVAGASGGCRGMIFLFAEPSRGVVVEMTSRRLAHREIRDDTLVRTNHFLLGQMQPFASEPPQRNTLRRYQRAHELLDPLPNKNVADLVRLSRDHNDGPDSICSDDAQHLFMTVSACTHVVRADTLDPLAHTRVQMGNPRNTIAVPVPRAIEGLPLECADGTMHALARRLYARHGVGEHLAGVQDERERAISREFVQVGLGARLSEPGRLREALTGFAARCVESVRATLAHLLE